MRRGTVPWCAGKSVASIRCVFSLQRLAVVAIALRLDSRQEETRKEKKEMAESDIEQDVIGAEETAGEVRLWQAVVVRAIEDWMSGPLRQRRQADHYIFADNDFATVCQSARLDADDLRARLSKIRSRNLHEVQAIAA
jgi:hypothetical protein